MRGFAENAVCPRCRTYTQQTVVRRGRRRCFCGREFDLKDTLVMVRAGWVRCRCGHAGPARDGKCSQCNESYV